MLRIVFRCPSLFSLEVNSFYFFMKNFWGYDSLLIAETTVYAVSVVLSLRYGQYQRISARNERKHEARKKMYEVFPFPLLFLFIFFLPFRLFH